MFADTLRRDRTRWGLSVGHAAWRFGVRPAAYRELEAGTRWPSFETYDRICKLFGWPQAFAWRRQLSLGRGRQDRFGC
jgi:predicted transcriptional regulator